LEADDLVDRLFVPRHLLWYFLHPQPVDLGTEIIWCCALHHNVCDVVSLVWRLGTFSLLGLLLRIPQGQYRASSENEPDPAANPGPVVVYEASFHYHGGRCASIWCRFYRALLHHVIDMATSVLLPLRVSSASASHPVGHLRGDCHGFDILPANGRRL